MNNIDDCIFFTCMTLSGHEPQCFRLGPCENNLVVFFVIFKTVIAALKNLNHSESKTITDFVPLMDSHIHASFPNRAIIITP